LNNYKRELHQTQQYTLLNTRIQASNTDVNTELLFFPTNKFGKQHNICPY